MFSVSEISEIVFMVSEILYLVSVIYVTYSGVGSLRGDPQPPGFSFVPVVTLRSVSLSAVEEVSRGGYPVQGVSRGGYFLGGGSPPPGLFL
jgi:hypothetical protein